jgi:hypothetical protein
MYEKCSVFVQRTTPTNYIHHLGRECAKHFVFRLLLDTTRGIHSRDTQTQEMGTAHTRVNPKYSGLVPPSIQQLW